MKNSSIFCDWLDVTCNPSDSFVPPLRMLLMLNSFEPFISDVGRVVYRVGDGTVSFDLKSTFHRSSISGSGIRALESSNMWLDYLNVIGSVPHTITRNDLALDLPIDAPDFLRGLEARYPDDRFSFTRKSLRVKRVYSARESDGQQTGTWYAGLRTKSSVTCRVYDKQEEMLVVKGVSIPPTTRIELTFRKGVSTSLFDVLYPDDLFYHFACPGLLDSPPDGVVPWYVRGTNAWVSTKSEPRELLSISKFTQAVDSSPSLVELCKLGLECGAEAKPILLRRFSQILDSILTEEANQNCSSD